MVASKKDRNPCLEQTFSIKNIFYQFFESLNGKCEEWGVPNRRAGSIFGRFAQFPFRLEKKSGVSILAILKRHLKTLEVPLIFLKLLIQHNWKFSGLRFQRRPQGLGFRLGL